MAPPFDAQVTFVYASDLTASIHFYSEILGLPLVIDQGTCRIYQVSSDGFVGICKTRPSRLLSPDGVTMTLVTAHVDDWHRRLKHKGVEFEIAPTKNTDFGIYHCLLRDPDGYRIEIQQFLGPVLPEI